MRSTGLRAFACLALVVSVAAACGRVTERPRRTDDVQLLRETVTTVARVPPDATLVSLLQSHGLAGPLVVEAVQAARDVFDLRAIKAGRVYRLVLGIDGLLREFRYEIDADRFLLISPGAEPAEPGGTRAGLVASVGAFEKTRSVMGLQGAIDESRTSLVASIENAGERVDLALGMADIFGGEIDFHHDLRQGDRFALVFESFTREEQFANYGHILTAELLNDGRTLRAYRFELADGKAGYYDDEGRSLKRRFLRSPLRFEPRITSRFSNRRLHPVLRVYRPHHGVDYGAPAGSAVVAVASGVVVSAGWSGGSGRMVRLRHADGYETYYLHLSSIAVRRGARVAQGQLIGRVGSSGLATAAHLDYRVRKNGRFINPLTLHRSLPPGEPIPAGQLPAFQAWRDRVLASLVQARTAVDGALALDTAAAPVADAVDEAALTAPAAPAPDQQPR
jgi:murein DD-endopeptidase MepM/ murein hydrolase activator NlpD